MDPSIEKQQKKAIRYYNKLSGVYDFISNWYYKKPRHKAVEELQLKKNQTVLNVPCGTGVNFKYFQQYLKNTGLIIGIDLSAGMLHKAEQKIKKNQWSNIKIELNNATKIDPKWLEDYAKHKGAITIDAIFCDLGLSGLPEWKNIVDNMISLLEPGGRIVILDWYIKTPGLKAKFIKWIGKGEVTRPIWQYLESRISDFKLANSFRGGNIFVASGTKK